MPDDILYSVRDAAGNTYGPATIATLRDWYRQGRIIAAMQIAPQGTTDWLSLPAHPGLSDLFPSAVAAASAPATSPAPQPAATPATPTPEPSPTLPAPAPAPAAPDIKAAVEKAKRFNIQDILQLQQLAPLAFWGIIVSAAGFILCCGCGGILGIVGGVLGAFSLDRGADPQRTVDPRVRKGAYIAIGLGVLALFSNCAGMTLLSILRSFGKL